MEEGVVLRTRPGAGFRHEGLRYIIWDHPNNAELKQKKGNPNVLLPGGRLFLPGIEKPDESCPADQRHRFKAVSRLRLRLVLEGLLEIGQTACELQLAGGTRQVTTGRPGIYRRHLRVPDSARCKNRQGGMEVSDGRRDRGAAGELRHRWQAVHRRGGWQHVDEVCTEVTHG